MNTQVSKEIVPLHLLHFAFASPNFSSLFCADQNPCQVQLPLPTFIIVLSTNIGEKEWENSLMANTSDLVLNPFPCRESPLLCSSPRSSYNAGWFI